MVSFSSSYFFTHFKRLFYFNNLGILVSVDGYMNLQMANAEEWIDGVNQGNLGEILIRYGFNIFLRYCIDYFRCNNVLYIGGSEEAEA